MCANQCANQPIKGIEKKEWEEGGGQETVKKYKKVDGGVRRTLSPALGVESSETGSVPWVRLESIVRRIA